MSQTKKSYPNFTISVTANPEKHSLLFQCTAENVTQGDIEYFLGIIAEGIKENDWLDGLTRENGGYVHENIDL